MSGSTDEGLVLFLVVRLATHRTGALAHPGRASGWFALIYGLARIFAEYFRVPLTTVRQPKFRLGVTAMEMMRHLLRGERVESKRQPAELILRASTAPLAK